MAADYLTLIMGTYRVIAIHVQIYGVNLLELDRVAACDVIFHQAGILLSGKLQVVWQW